MSVVSNTRVMQAMEEGSIVIEPFNKSHLSTSSYDVCLGENYYRPQTGMLGNIFNIYDSEHVQRVWGDPQIAQSVEEHHKFIKSYLLDAKFKADDKIILLAPGETILAHTDEFIGGRNTITTMMKARSSLGRSFITVCKCAGWGDVGYVNRWTMEITNVSTNYSIPLLVGERIAQIIFFDAPDCEGDYSDVGSYQTTTDIAQLKANWQPSSMLPRTKRK